MYNVFDMDIIQSLSENRAVSRKQKFQLCTVSRLVPRLLNASEDWEAWGWGGGVGGWPMRRRLMSLQQLQPSSRATRAAKGTAWENSLHPVFPNKFRQKLWEEEQVGRMCYWTRVWTKLRPLPYERDLLARSLKSLNCTTQICAPEIFKIQVAFLGLTKKWRRKIGKELHSEVVAVLNQVPMLWRILGKCRYRSTISQSSGLGTREWSFSHTGLLLQEMLARTYSKQQVCLALRPGLNPTEDNNISVHKTVF